MSSIIDQIRNVQKKPLRPTSAKLSPGGRIAITIGTLAACALAVWGIMASVEYFFGE